jgi:hypothetical protein
MADKYIDLTIPVPCPHHPNNLLETPRLRVRPTKGSELVCRCPHCGAARHSLGQYKDTCPDIYILLKGIEKENKSTIDDSTESSEEEYTSNSAEPDSTHVLDSTQVDSGESVLSIKKDVKDVRIELSSLLLEECTLNSKIANLFQEIVDNSPIRPPGSKKADLGSTTFRLQLWKYRNGCAEKLLCPCCKQQEISFDKFVAGHIHPESRGGDISMDNLLPICNQCNVKMGFKHMYYYTWNTWKRALWNPTQLPF